jgi:hypothetical protein
MKFRVIVSCTDNPVDWHRWGNFTDAAAVLGRDTRMRFIGDLNYARGQPFEVHAANRPKLKVLLATVDALAKSHFFAGHLDIQVEDTEKD